jgi:hypothetical protein
MGSLVSSEKKTSIQFLEKASVGRWVLMTVIGQKIIYQQVSHDWLWHQKASVRRWVFKSVIGQKIVESSAITRIICYHSHHLLSLASQLVAHPSQEEVVTVEKEREKGRRGTQKRVHQ